MPDFTYEYAYICPDNEQCTVEIKGKTDSYTCNYGMKYDGSFEMGWTCNCEGFKYRKTCKHIVEAENKRCKWNENADAFIDPLEIDKIKYCPICKKEAIIVKIAV